MLNYLSTLKLIFDNIIMKLKAKELIKTLLSQKGIKQKDLIVKLEEITDRKYSASCFSHRISSGSITYNEVLQIAEILGYDIEFKNNDNEMI